MRDTPVSIDPCVIRRGLDCIHLLPFEQASSRKILSDYALPNNFQFQIR
jgi:hypothetical protein